MNKPWQPKVLRDLHKIREEIYEEAQKVGVDKYYMALNKKAGWLLGKGKKARVAQVREKATTKYKGR